MNNKAIFSVDLEDWFNILDYKINDNIDLWSYSESQIELMTEETLSFLDENNIKATFFCLFYFANKYPDLIKKISRNGHEIASHGYFHKRLNLISLKDIQKELFESKKILEDITGSKILGYRSPGFSKFNDQEYFYDKCIEAGYEYDSSISLIHNKISNEKNNKFINHDYYINNYGKIKLFKINTIDNILSPFSYNGGSFIRFTPYFIIKNSVKNKQNKKLNIFYIHPRELYPNHIRINKISLKKKLNYYYGLNSVKKKYSLIFKNFNFSKFNQIINNDQNNI